MNTRLGKPYMPTVPADFAGAMKGKKTVASLRDAVSTTLANAKIEANAIADRIDANLKALREQAKDHAFLFADTAQLVLKAPDDCQAIITARISEHKAAEDKRLAEERERIAAEERQKWEAAVRAEQQAKAATESAPVVTAATAWPFPSTGKTTVPTTTQPAPALRLGQINERLGFTVTADFLTNLGFPPAATEKRAKLYYESDMPAICTAISNHVIRVGSMREAA